MNHEKLLQLVETITSYSDAEDVDMDVARGRKTTKREQRLAGSLNQIYCAVHAFRQMSKPGCKHQNWLNDAEDQYKQFVKDNII